jgi:hypothetical protein
MNKKAVPLKREKINPVFACAKGSHPTWSDAEECRSNWTKSKWKRAKQKKLKTKETIKNLFIL